MHMQGKTFIFYTACKYAQATVSKVASLHLNYIRVIGVSANTIEKVSVVTEKNISYLAKMQENGTIFQLLNCG